jgi:hypothetical protein
MNYKNGECSVGTYDLGRRYRTLKEGEYPPFRYQSATFYAEKRNGRITWGEQIDDG